ncbi:hypothetical protein KLM61_04690 [Clostridioides difficile]|nr:hypothetical protein [Clostridioides difficile]
MGESPGGTDKKLSANHTTDTHSYHAEHQGLASREVENIFENSDFVLMLNQAQGDRAILAKQLNISPQQMKYVTHTEAGEGLIFYGNVVLPFVDHFPKDTELYRIMTTKPEEVSSL